MTPIQTAARTIAAAHGLASTQVTELPGGVANHVFRLGPALILRIPRSATFIPDLHKEAAVVPAARAAGVRTPAIVAQGTIPVDDIPTPYVVMERVHGQDLVTHSTPKPAKPTAMEPQPDAADPGPRTAGIQPDAAKSGPRTMGIKPGTTKSGPRTVGIQPDAAESGPRTAGIQPGTAKSRPRTAGIQPGTVGPEAGTDFWAALGREVAKLHQVRRQQRPTDDLGSVPEDSGYGRGSADELVDRGYLDAETGRRLGSWMDELRGRFDENSPRVLLHGDLAPQNLMVDDAGRFVALIDWGDAAWGPRGMEFAKLRLEDVVRVLPAYKDFADVQFEYGELEAAVLWFHLQWGLSNLTGPPRIGERHWTAPPTSRVLGVLRFLASAPPDPWGTVTTRDSPWPG